MATERAIIRNHQLVYGDNMHAPHLVDVLKVAHHGSRFSTSEDWLQYWQPMSAAVSVGATNSYGHPHPDVLARLTATKAPLWRTDKHGEIRYLVTKDEMFIRPNNAD